MGEVFFGPGVLGDKFCVSISPTEKGLGLKKLMGSKEIAILLRKSEDCFI